MPQASGTLSGAQISGFASAAGFSGKSLDTITAIALAESGGNPKAHNGNPPDNSYGLTQVNMIGNLGPSRRAQFHLKSNDDLYDPATNMRVAYALSSHGTNFKPWTTYTSGSYKKFLGQSDQSGAGKVPLQGFDPDTTTQSNAGLFGGVQDSIHQFTETIRMSAILFTIIWVAIVLLILGIIILNRERAGRVASMVGPAKAVRLAKAVA